MFGRANKNYEARKSAVAAVAKPAAPTAKSALEKQLFPSSSPRDSSIAEFYKKPSFSKPAPPTTGSNFRRWPSGSSTTGASTKPLGSRSPNVGRVPFQESRSAGSNSFVTLCGNNAGSFSDDSLVANQPPAAAAGVGTMQTGVDDALLGFVIDPDDFSDDENLDLDFQAPIPLPPQPSAPKPAAVADDKENIAIKEAKESVVIHDGFQPSASLDSACSWPPSSPSHHLPPAQRPNNNRVPSVKRDHADANSEPSPLPVAKKRTMPKNWSKAEEEEPASAYSAMPSATPSTKPKSDMLWDATASAVKAQKKQLKDQFKKPSLSDNEHGNGASAETSQEAMAPVSKPKPKPQGAVTLSAEQQQVKNLVCIKNASVFFTGPAGTGKSVLMRSIIRDLQRKYARDPEKLGVAASTGLAACNIGGMTLHSFAGIGLGKEDAQTLVKKIRRNPKAKGRWLKTKTLVIDEVSMVDGELFDKLSQIGRTIRNNGRPWGGIQLVLTGDFFQLPPVPDREKRDIKFAFEATTWNTSIDHTIGLTEVFRQKDPEFAEMLNEMRLGRISDKTVKIFKSLERPLQFDDGLEVTELFPTRNEVDNSNERRLRALAGRPFRYDAFDTGNPDLRDKLLQNMMAPKSLELRKGAQVMLIKNMDETLVNGSLGTVVKFMTERDYESSGGEFMDVMDADAKKRAKLFSKFLDGADGGGGAGSQVYPYVQFHAVDGSSRGILVRQEEWKVELPTGEVQASRKQLPLILAWALSIHKAQGQTLERVKVDLGKVFEKGQAYVALSRATTKHGLQVMRFEKHKVMAHPRVIGFYQRLYSAESALKAKGGSSILAFARNTEQEIDTPGNSFVRKQGKSVKQQTKITGRAAFG